jgi:glycosyltransferase involved in cell wall biosynthesis
VPSKAYEYLAAGGRILAITEENGATADLVNNMGGELITPGNHNAIKGVIKRWYDDHKKKDGKENEHATLNARVMHYEWGELGRIYAQILESTETMKK